MSRLYFRVFLAESHGLLAAAPLGGLSALAARSRTRSRQDRRDLPADRRELGIRQPEFPGRRHRRRSGQRPRRRQGSQDRAVQGRRQQSAKPRSARPIGWRPVKASRIFVGSSTSAVGMVASQEAERNGAFYWEGMAVANSYTERGFKYAFRMGLSAAGLGQPAPLYVAEVLAPLLKIEPKAIKVAVIAEDSAFGVDVSKAAIDQAEKLGIKVGLRELYSAKTTDLSPLVLKLRSLDSGRHHRHPVHQRRHPAAASDEGDELLRRRRSSAPAPATRRCRLPKRSARTSTASSRRRSRWKPIPLRSPRSARRDREEFVKRYQAKYNVDARGAGIARLCRRHGADRAT